MNMTPQKTRKEFDALSILSFMIGGLSLFLMELMPMKIIYSAGNLLLSILGLVLAFAGRINIRKTNALGKKFALGGFILNLIDSSGMIVFLVRSALGNPVFGVSAEEDRRMIFFIVASLVLCGLVVTVSVCYGKIAKKDIKRSAETI